MFGWRRRRDGFEWHEYVRTTILVRRKKRREKLDDVRQAAVAGLKDAGAAAAAGLRNAGDKGLAAGAAGAASAADAARQGAGAIGGGLGRLASATAATPAAMVDLLRSAKGPAARLADIATAPLTTRLQTPASRKFTGALGFAALAAALWRVVTIGIDARSIGAAVIGAGLTALWLAAERRHAGHEDRTACEGPRLRLVPVAGWGVAGIVAVLGLGRLMAPPDIESQPAARQAAASSLKAVGSSDAGVTGQATALSGDMLRIAGRTVRLAHIEAPDTGQTCRRGDGRTWRCGESARTELARLVRGARIACTITSEAEGVARADCRKGDADIAASLVSGGHVFAEAGFFARHSGAEAAARENKLGLWQGEAQRPASYREALWQAASKNAPDGCPIKGRVSSRGKFYVLPWSSGYERVRVRESLGGRWFCSEDEAKSAGWQPSNAS